MNDPSSEKEHFIEIEEQPYYRTSKYGDRILNAIPYAWRIYYFCSDIKVYFVSKYQQLRYGVSDRECWDLSNNFTNYILPRLKHFKKMDRFGFPASLTEEKWETILDEIIWSFEYMKDPSVYNPIPQHWHLENESLAEYLNRKKTPEEEKCNEEYMERCKQLEEKKKKGLLLFVEYYENLWD